MRLNIDLDDLTSEDLEEYAKRAGLTKKSIVVSALKLYLKIKDSEEYYRKKYEGRRITASIEFRPMPDENAPMEERLAGLLIY